MPVLKKNSLAARVAAFPRIVTGWPGLKQAAVAVCVTEHEGLRPSC